MLVYLKIGGGQGGGGGFNPPILNIARHWPYIAKHFGLLIPQIFFNHCNARLCLNIWNLQAERWTCPTNNAKLDHDLQSLLFFLGLSLGLQIHSAHNGCLLCHLSHIQPISSRASPVLNALLPSPPNDLKIYIIFHEVFLWFYWTENVRSGGISKIIFHKVYKLYIEWFH